jgi:carboxymethylenebutenolidase
MIILDTETVDLPTMAGPMRTHLFRPAAPGRYPGLVLYSEIFQVTGPIRRTAAMMAGHGFSVAVPEVYHELEAPGTVLGYTPEGSARGNAHKVAKSLESYDSDARACIAFLKDAPHCTGRIGAMGMCLGGHLAFRAALQPEILAAACLYPTDLHKRSLGKGSADDSLDRVREIGGELLMIFGRQDPHIPAEARAAIYQALSGAERHFEWHEFNAAHAFLRDEGNRYNPSLAHLTYGLVVELFRRKLGEGDVRA